MRSDISQFVTPVSVTVLFLVVIGFNGILAEEYANLRKMEVEHRRHHSGNITEVRDHPSGHGSHGHNRGPYPSTSQDKYKRPKPDYSAPKHQSRPSTSSHLPSKALNQAPAFKAASYTPPSYSSPAYTSPVYAPPAYNPVAYSHPSYTPPTNKPPASSSPAYSPSVYNAPTYSPPAYNPPAHSSPAYTPKGVESPTYTESPGNKPAVYPSATYSEAPASESEYPYKNIPEKNNGVTKGISFNSDFPKFDDFVQHVESIKFDQFKI